MDIKSSDEFRTCNHCTHSFKSGEALMCSIDNTGVDEGDGCDSFQVSVSSKKHFDKILGNVN